MRPRAGVLRDGRVRVRAANTSVTHYEDLGLAVRRELEKARQLCREVGDWKVVEMLDAIDPDIHPPRSRLVDDRVLLDAILTVQWIVGGAS